MEFGERWFPQHPPTGNAGRGDVPAIDRAGTSAVAIKIMLAADYSGRVLPRASGQSGSAWHPAKRHARRWPA
jgi:hypothetical protein